MPTLLIAENVEFKSIFLLEKEASQIYPKDIFRHIFSLNDEKINTEFFRVFSYWDSLLRNWSDSLKNNNIIKMKYDGDFMHYNYFFNKKNGYFMRWGKQKEDNPDFAPFPEIADMEISTICHGIPNEKGILTPCPFCYKGNTSIGKNMTLEEFKVVFDKFAIGEKNGKKIYG